MADEGLDSSSSLPFVTFTIATSRSTASIPIQSDTFSFPSPPLPPPTPPISVSQYLLAPTPPPSPSPKYSARAPINCHILCSIGIPILVVLFSIASYYLSELYTRRQRRLRKLRPYEPRGECTHEQISFINLEEIADFEEDVRMKRDNEEEGRKRADGKQRDRLQDEIRAVLPGV